MKSETGGLRVGSSFYIATNFTWPFAILRFDRNSLEIETSIFGLFGNIRQFERGLIDCVSVHRGVFSSGICVEHTSKTNPPFLLFWTFAADRVLEALQEDSYTTNKKKANKAEMATPRKSSD